MGHVLARPRRAGRDRRRRGDRHRRQGRRRSTPTAAGAGQLPANSFALVGREQGAAALRALQVGDAVTLAYDLKSDIADTLDFAVGGRQILVKDGVPQPESVVGTDGQAPRTSIGFKDGGKTMLLVTADGRQSLVLGPTRAQMGELMADAGRRDRAEPRRRRLDDDGRPPARQPAGDGPQHAVRRQRARDPNGVGVFVAPGDGTVHDLADRPGRAPASSPACTATLQRGRRRRSRHAGRRPTSRGALGRRRRRLKAPEAGHRDGARPRGRAPSRRTDVRVLGKPVKLEPSALRLSFAEPSLQRRHAARQRPRRATASRRRSTRADLSSTTTARCSTITPSGDGLRVDPIADGATILTVRAAGLAARVPVTVGAQTRLISGFDTVGVWRFRHDRSPTGGISIVDEGHTGKGLKVDYDFTAGDRHPQRRRASLQPADHAPRPAAARVACGSRATARASG